MFFVLPLDWARTKGTIRRAQSPRLRSSSTTEHRQAGWLGRWLGRWLASWRRPLAAGVLILLAGGVFHGWTVVENFSRQHWEDQLFYRHVADHVTTAGECLTAPSMWSGLYRPLTTNCYYHLGEALFGHRIEVYHSINAALVWVNAFLLFLVARFLLSYPGALLAGALYATRIAHVEVVQNTVEFQVLFSTTWSLMAFLVFLHARRRARDGESAAALVAGCVGCTALALLSKETASVWPVLFVLAGWLLEERRVRRVHFVPALAVLVWAVLFAVLRPNGGTYDSGLSWVFSLQLVLVNYAAHFLDFANLLAWPLDNPVMDRTVLGLAVAWPAQLGVALLLGVGAGAVVLPRLWSPAAHPNVRAALFGLAWFAVLTAPFVFFPDRLYMRYSYPGHAGLALSFAAVGVMLVRSARRVVRKSTVGAG